MNQNLFNFDDDAADAPTPAAQLAVQSAALLEDVPSVAPVPSPQPTQAKTGSAHEKPGTASSPTTPVTPLTSLTYVLCIEGKELPIDAEIAADDDSIKTALATAYPEITTAEVTRTTKEGVQRITVIKRGGPKGNGSAKRGVQGR
ncbi:MAG: hypothetical protein HC853_00745 [Anaerolineae bacterium]|nr:hypothetical protein [Anaerolineae bacterium]